MLLAKPEQVVTLRVGSSLHTGCDLREAVANAYTYYEGKPR